MSHIASSFIAGYLISHFGRKHHLILKAREVGILEKLAMELLHIVIG